MTKLFSPIIIRNKKIKNRIVLPPMVRFGWSDSEGFVSEKHIKNYRIISEDGPGLIIIEALAVKKDGRLSSDQLGIWSDDHIDGIKKIADACHKNGAVIIAQIHHAGLSTPDAVISLPVAPSDQEKDGQKKARALELPEIENIQEAFVQAARRAKEAGLDGVEVHGAHGFLIEQFISPITNKRDDKYGGDITNRSRFAHEIIKKIRDLDENRDFIIGYRMGGNEPTLKDGIKIAKNLENTEIDILHVSLGIQGDELPVPPKDLRYNWVVFCGTEIKKNVTIPIIVVNEIRTPEQAKYLIANNMADFVAIGKGHLCDPDWTKKARKNSEVKECMECDECKWFSEPEKCPRYKKFLLN